MLSTGSASGKTTKQPQTTTQPQVQEESTAERVIKPRVNAQVCPSCKGHSTRIYKTIGRIRRVCCDTCGHTWKQTGPFADELREYAMQFADSLKQAKPEQVGDGSYIILDVALAKELEETFRRLATT